MTEPDVIVIGSGGGGAVMAKELGEKGLNVLVLEAGPWYGNSQWPEPNKAPGALSGTDPGDLDIALLREQYNKREEDMNDLITGKLRWGPADRSRAPWFRNVTERGFVWQSSGVGGTTQIYLANSPRAFPAAVDGIWPLSYRELIPYYEKVEATLPVAFAPMSPKEELFFYGAKQAGWKPIPTLDVRTPGYRPQPNAILPPNGQLMNPDYSTEALSRMEGCTLAGHCINGCPHGPSVDRVAKRSANVSYIPLALRTGRVTIRPNAFVTRIVTEKHPAEGLRAVGVQIRDTWTGEMDEVRAAVVVMAAGAIESPRLWLNSGLPSNPWVGRGLVNHYIDWVTGMFDECDLVPLLGSPEINPFMGHTSGARLDYPGLGSILVTGMSPGLTASMSFGVSQSGYSPVHPPHPGHGGYARGRVVGPRMQHWMENYRRTLSLAITADDGVNPRNGVTLDPLQKDEHGPVPKISYVPGVQGVRNRNGLMQIAVDILRKAGARKVLRTDWPASLMIHMESTMRMGGVVDGNGESYQVKRLYIADNSVHFNGLGGANPTLTTQALATRTSEKLAELYF
ncbi:MULTISPECIES: GMC family oxidoreductase N-terminal domain-containing protein [Paenibacillus]|uniref:GMC family oxidoreductase N-terminal domain-containing protein n=1 Tax=Paenibacillus TaxID=44249 RepID=UPI0022B8CCC7|nr:GMC family oxidoreductase N-terminal domain-containing protein [Paenibacillus caseinilyticus]MCZ8522215.1 GMC family oxidoreductase N-terminal domain-containing protein [Paenibacillus caseinilyticus]